MTAKTLWILSAVALLAVSVCQVRTIHLHYTFNMGGQQGFPKRLAISNPPHDVTCQTKYLSESVRFI